ncbi:MAG: hypothetical protein KDE33_20925 [Bacteroidetes bacterium]|nr:hypothetical protein [Bacteroidota bacterium]
MENNTQLHSVIKLRHLKNASQNNWEMLRNTQMMVNKIIVEAQQIINSYGNETAKEQFEKDIEPLSKHILDIQQLLNDFRRFIDSPISVNLESSFQKFNTTIEEAYSQLKKISFYPSSYFKDNNANDWNDIWNVVISNMTTVQGVGEAGYIKALMIKNFNGVEVDDLTNKIIKHIPQSFNLLEADKYRKEYLQAVKEIEDESNSKDNLWDRFLNVLAGNIPFKQTPEERVMMRRWLDGEKGEL